jgi:hypothetical protein
MPKSLSRALVMVLAIAFFVAGQETGALAAATTGTISGTVTDSAGHPIAGVSISAVSPSETARTVTASNGFYSMTGLSPDTYVVTFTQSSYQTQQVTGVTVVQGQTSNISIVLQSGTTVLGHVTVRGATSLVQPKTTADTYTVNAQTVTQVTGTPQNISETALLDSLPGITRDVNGYPIIRGGAENEEGYELEGIDATDPITGQFINSLSLAGESRVELSTGGYDVSAGNTNAGVINEVIKRGAYPGAGELTSTINMPNFDHRLAMEYGNATPDNNFSYFFAFNGLRQFRIYGDDKTFEPNEVGAVGDASGNIDVTNLFYRWGSDQRNELEYMGETGASLFQFDNGVNPNTTPYATNNTEVKDIFGPTIISELNLYPGQTAIDQNTGYPDNENNVHTIEKLNYKRQFSESSFGDFTLFRTIESDIFLFPWDGGAFGDEYENNVNTNNGVQFDYQNQINSEHYVSVGGATIDTTSKYNLGEPSFGPFIFSGIDPLTNFYPQTEGLVNDPLHRSNLWLQDKYTPTDRWTIQPGVRWDQEILDIPADAAAQNLSLANENGLEVELPGQPITNAVTHPEQVSPRLAVSYQASSNNVFRFSYGKNIEFTPFSNIEFKWAGDNALMNEPISPLPGFSPTCVLGKDPANGNTPCNGISNYYQLFRDEYNTSFFSQYTPVLPQTATNSDISWEHDMSNGFQLKITPYYRKGVDYVVESTPLLFTLPTGTPIFGSPREENAGINENTGVEAIIQRNASVGWSGFLDATYDNTLANYNSDFFPSENNAALALNHFFHVSYLAPVTANFNLNYDQRHGWHIYNEFTYESGYRYGVGKDTFVYEGNCIPGAPEIPIEVLNTDLAEGCLGNSAAESAYYYTDPTNPGTILHPNITGSRGTPDGNDPGTLRGPQLMTWNLAFSHDIGAGTSPVQAGVRIDNVLGNYTPAGAVGGNFYYINNGLGGYGPGSGSNGNIGFEPYQYNRSPLPFINEPTGTARTLTFFLDEKF